MSRNGRAEHGTSKPWSTNAFGMQSGGLFPTANDLPLAGRRTKMSAEMIDCERRKREETKKDKPRYEGNQLAKVW